MRRKEEGDRISPLTSYYNLLLIRAMWLYRPYVSPVLILALADV